MIARTCLVAPKPPTHLRSASPLLPRRSRGPQAIPSHCESTFPSSRDSTLIWPVRRQRSLDRPGGLNKGEFLAHRNVHRSEDETANPTIEGTS
jgi:hypothetical protein